MKFLISFIGAIFWPKITSSVKKYFITLRPRSTHVIKQGSRGLNRSRPQEKIRSRKSGRLMLRVPLEVKPLLFSTSCLIYQTNQNYPTSSKNHLSLKIHNSMKIIKKTKSLRHLFSHFSKIRKYKLDDEANQGVKR